MSDRDRSSRCQPGESRSSSPRMTTARVVPNRVCFDIGASELVEDRGSRFEERFRKVFRSGAQEIVVNLGDGPDLTGAALGALLRARAETVRAGMRLVVRPGSRRQQQNLEELGLGEILGLAA